MISWLLLLLGGLSISLYLIFNNKSAAADYLKNVDKTVLVDNMVEDSHQAVNLKVLTEESFTEKLNSSYKRTLRRIGAYAEFKIVLFGVLLTATGGYLNQSFFRVDDYLIIIPVVIGGMIFGAFFLKGREQRQFEAAFPDALNVLTGAVSAGESVIHAIIYVGNNIDGPVGKEFKLMGERLQMGETPDSVFKKSCKVFPYPSFQFFIITLRANLQRGGQLKDVLTRLNRLMFEAHAIEKKKYSLTSEARMSAKIVGAIPFIFLLILQYISPENYEFVMFNDSGKPILYYMLVSEAIGLFIIWKLMKSVGS
ncbi:pilus assembly protein TadB [Vibrio owensii 47666-1]|uniref:type II secretion system F family protein n=1 Tax=Vibrio owensii TaxID=696485 RepID=UPI000584BC43|nr:type II secretion system F family protein [Vibrio owensii]KIF48801.1 pilus assembly protein TadB [Vibrio owensii 47666-1]